MTNQHWMMLIVFLLTALFGSIMGMIILSMVP